MGDQPGKNLFPLPVVFASCVNGIEKAFKRVNSPAIPYSHRFGSKLTVRGRANAPAPPL
jgi:hypothetical protein